MILRFEPDLAVCPVASIGRTGIFTEFSVAGRGTTAGVTGGMVGSLSVVTAGVTTGGALGPCSVSGSLGDRVPWFAPLGDGSTAEGGLLADSESRTATSRVATLPARSIAVTLIG